MKFIKTEPKFYRPAEEKSNAYYDPANPETWPKMIECCKHGTPFRYECEDCAKDDELIPE